MRTNPTTDFVMTCDGPRSLDHIEAHARNELSVNPGSVNANDKFLLVREIRRLRAELKTLRGSHTMNNKTTAPSEYQDGFYWVTRFLYAGIRRVAPERPEPEVSLHWKGRWHFAGDDNPEDDVWMIHSRRLEKPDV